MKRFFTKAISIVCTLTMIFGLGTKAYAFEESSSELREKRIVSELMQDGLSRNDAEYYAALDTMIRSMEQSGEILQLDDTIDALDPQIALANQTAFRDRVLQKDPSALKCALSMTLSLSAQEEMQNLATTYQGQDEYTIIYPDGSKIHYGAASTELKDPNTLYASQTITDTFKTGTNTSYTNYNAYAEYKITSAVNYSKTRVDCEYKYASTGVTMTYAEGTQSSYGVILISNSNSGEISREKSTSTKPAEANNQVVYQVSGSIGFTMNNVSVSISAGANWTNTVYFRVTKDGEWSAVAVVYT